MSRAMITHDDFIGDAHAARYVPILAAHPAATNRLLELLNDPQNEQRLLHASELGDAALRGIAFLIEGEPAISAVIAPGPASRRFRQAIGVAVRLKMEELGWSTTGRKGVVTNSSFVRAERYSPA